MIDTKRGRGETTASGVAGPMLFDSSHETIDMRSDFDDDAGEASDEGIARRPTSRNQLVEWVLVDGDRKLVTLVLSLGVFVSLLVGQYLGIVAFTNGDSITRMASGMIAGSFSLVTIVVSVNQLILSQEFSPAGESRDELESVMEFQRDTEDVTSVPAAPATPIRLIELLLVAIGDRANVLAETVTDHADEPYQDRIAQYARSVSKTTLRIDETLEGANATAFEALLAAIEYDDSWQLYVTRYLRNDAPTLSPETERAFDELIDTLELFNTAQAHFKTIYFQRELTRFSQLTIISGVPALGAAVLITLLYGDPGGATISYAYYPYVISLLATVVFVPVGLLTAYILRTATLSRRTAAIGPMLFGKNPVEGPFDISYGEAE